MKNNKVPSHTKVLVIGGGPGGSLTATLLTQEGIDVVVCEKEKFPRYHIGESLLPSLLPILDYVGLREKMDNHGFIKKYGAHWKIKQDLPDAHTNFRKQEKYKYSYQVIRSEFDELLLNFAESEGAQVFQETRISAVTYKDNKPVSAHYIKSDKSEGDITFDFLVDASGLTGLISNQYMKNRKWQPAFANVALCKYWKNFNDYKDHNGKEYPGEFLCNACSDGSGWIWAIPLHDGTISIGVVIPDVHFKKLQSENLTLDQIYNAKIDMAWGVKEILNGASPVGETKFWNDYSYYADTFAGENLRLVGDAAAFLDPLLSSGLHLATVGALSAAASICSVIRGECTPEEGARFHDSNVRSIYTRYSLLVSAVYQQITNQKDVVLHGIKGKDLQSTFDIIQPILSGNLDMNKDQPVPGEVTKQVQSYIQSLWAERHIADHPSAHAEVFQEGGKSFSVELGRQDMRADSSSAIEGFHIRLEEGNLGLQRMDAK